MEDKRSEIGDDGRGEEDTNATVLEGEVDLLLPLPEPLDGVFWGDRKHDFVGEVKDCICAEARRTVSVHLRVRLSMLSFPSSTWDSADRGES